jgi:hypothetical protein
VIVEKQAMAQDIVANAAALANDLRTTGHVTVEGIYFDTGRAMIKPESAKAIGEIAKLLAGDPTLKVYVVGHTDSVGVLDANMRLSQERADAVAQALVQTHGIAAARLKSFGNGPYAPVASNDAEAGRARNRRVELVKPRRRRAARAPSLRRAAEAGATPSDRRAGDRDVPARDRHQERDQVTPAEVERRPRSRGRAAAGPSGRPRGPGRARPAHRAARSGPGAPVGGGAAGVRPLP